MIIKTSFTFFILDKHIYQKRKMFSLSVTEVMTLINELEDLHNHNILHKYCVSQNR